MYFTAKARYNHRSFDDNPDGLKLVWLPKEDGKHIPCLLYRDSNFADKKVIVYFHGSYEDLGWEGMTDDIVEMAHMWRMSVLCVEYPGYGLNFNRGIATPADIKLDACKVINYLRYDLGLRGKDIILMGRSLGTGVALHCSIAMDEQPCALIIVSPFTSIRDVVKDKNSCVGSLLTKQHFNSSSIIQYIQSPLYIVHGMLDPLVLV